MQFCNLKEILTQTKSYEIFQVPSSNNDKDELNQAFHKLVFIFHPDVVTSNDNKVLANDVFDKIIETWNTLLNDSKTCRITNGNNFDATAAWNHHGQQEVITVGQYEK